MKFIHKLIIGTLSILLFIFAWLTFGLASEISTIEDEKEFSDHWSCMDGCYNMLLVVYEDVQSSNKTLEGYHSECSDMCFDQKMISLSDFNGKVNP